MLQGYRELDSHSKIEVVPESDGKRSSLMRIGRTDFLSVKAQVVREDKLLITVYIMPYH